MVLFILHSLHITHMHACVTSSIAGYANTIRAQSQELSCKKRKHINSTVWLIKKKKYQCLRKSKKSQSTTFNTISLSISVLSHLAYMYIKPPP